MTSPFAAKNVKLHIVGNSSKIAAARELLREKLPRSWTVTNLADLLEVQVGGQVVTYQVIEKSRIEPKDVAPLLLSAKPTNLRILVAAPFLSSRTRELLTQMGSSYVDATGNIRIQSDSPPLYVELAGADRNPQATKRPVTRLKWGTTSRIVRKVITSRPPLSIQRLAALASTSTAQASRVAQFLESEAVVQRDARGQICDFNWESLLRRWADDYRFFETNQVTSLLAPRGINKVLERLRGNSGGYAVTGSFAARTLGLPIATQTLSVYTNDAAAIAKELELVPTSTGANVYLAVPSDEKLIGDAKLRDGLACAPIEQVAADLLTGRDRSSSEAEFLIEWMRAHELEWR